MSKRTQTGVVVARLALIATATLSACKGAPFSDGALVGGPGRDGGGEASSGGEDAGRTDADASADGAAAAPTPANIFGESLSLWLDASEAKTIEVDSGRVVGWTDRSPKKTTTEVFYPRPDDRAEVVVAAIHGQAALRLNVSTTRDSAPIIRVDSAYGNSDFILTMIVSYIATGRAYLQRDSMDLAAPELIANEDGGTKLSGKFSRAVETKWAAGTTVLFTL